MLSIALYLLTHAMLLSLHLSGGSFPRPLSAQEEKKYVERMLAGDIEARNVLVEHNLRLVAHIAKKYYTQSDEQDDLISIGTIGLIKGVSSYRPEKGTRLATYAAKCVENTMAPAGASGSPLLHSDFQYIRFSKSSPATNSSISGDTAAQVSGCRKVQSAVLGLLRNH